MSDTCDKCGAAGKRMHGGSISVYECGREADAMCGDLAKCGSVKPPAIANADCPKCGAMTGGFDICTDANGNPWKIPTATAEWSCGTYAVGEDIRQSSDCRIASLTHQLATVTKERDDARDRLSVIVDHVDDRLCDCAHTLPCGSVCSWCSETRDVYISRDVVTKRELQQQLADARLLAKAAREGVCDWDEETGIIEAATNLLSVPFDRACQFCDGLPVLTDELREQLQKAIGEI